MPPFLLDEASAAGGPGASFNLPAVASAEVGLQAITIIANSPTDAVTPPGGWTSRVSFLGSGSGGEGTVRFTLADYFDATNHSPYAGAVGLGGADQWAAFQLLLDSTGAYEAANVGHRDEWYGADPGQPSPTLVLPLDFAPTAGRVLLAYVAKSSYAGGLPVVDPSDPTVATYSAGWTPLAVIPSLGGLLAPSFVFYRLADGSETEFRFSWPNSKMRSLTALVVEYPLDTTGLAEPVGWDVYAAADPNGALLATLQRADDPIYGATGRKVRIALNETGSAGFEIHRYAPVATEANLAAGNIVKCRWPWRDGYDFAFILEKPDPLVLASADEEGGEKLTYAGRGALAYLDRAIMDAVAYTTGLDLADTWTEIWETKKVAHPVGAVVLDDDPTYVWVISATTRRVYKVRQSDRAIVSVSPALWSGSTKYAGGLCEDPADATVLWALETPWIYGAAGNTKIRKVRRSDWAILATYDLGSAVKLTDIRADATNLWTTRYDGTTSLYKRSKADGSVVTGYVVSYGGVNQTLATAVSINGTAIALWYYGKKRALITSTAAPNVVTDVISTHSLLSYGGAWTTEGGNEFFYPTDFKAGVLWKYQIVAATPHDPVDDKWRLDEATPGAVLWRIIAEAQAAGRPQQPLPDLTYAFTSALDSSADAWDSHDGTLEFDAAVGDGVLPTALRLTAYGLVLRMAIAPDALELVGRNLSSYGTDRTGVAFGAGVVRFEKGVNIVPELDRKEAERELHSHMLARGKDSLYARATLADLGYVREGFVATDLEDPTALAGTAEAVLDNERIRQERIAFKVPIGNDPDNGLYLPFTHYNEGDLVTLHTGMAEHDFTNEAFRLYAMTLEEGAAGDWPIATLELGSAYLADAPTPTSGGSSSSGSGGAGTVVQAQDVTVEGVDDTGTTTSSASGRKLRIPGATVLQEATGIVRIFLNGLASLLGLEDVDADDIVDRQVLVRNATDETFIAGYLEDVATAEVDATEVYAPDGAGGVAARAEDPIATHGSLGAAVTLDPADGAVHTGTLDADLTITLPALTVARSFLEAWLTQDGTGGHSVAVDVADAGTFAWDGDTPTLPTDPGVSFRLLFETVDAGATWLGVMVGGGGAATVDAATIRDAGRWEPTVDDGSDALIFDNHTVVMDWVSS